MKYVILHIQETQQTPSTRNEEDPQDDTLYSNCQKPKIILKAVGEK